MKKLWAVVVLALIACSCLSNVDACPKGTHPHGGVGSHHKGGWCS